MKRILFVTNDYLPMIGGVSNHIDFLARALASKECEVLILHFCYSNFGLPLEKKGGVKVERIVLSNDLIGKQSLYAKISRYIRTVYIGRKQLKKTIKIFRPDVIHWHDFYHSSLATKYLATECTLICTNHASQFLEQYAKSIFFHKYLSWLVNHADGIIGPSEELALKSRISFKPCRFIPNGVDENKFSPTRKYRAEIETVFKLSANDFLILAPRRLDPKNGLEILIRGMPAVISAIPNAHLIIAGGGEKTLREKYQSLIVSLGISTHVTITGEIDHKKIRKIISSADLVVIPSFFEAVSLAALEALAAGIPVVASNVGGLPYVVNEKNGILVPSGDVEKLSEAIIDILRSPKTLKTKSLAARRSILERFTWGHVAEETLQFYDYVKKQKA